MARLFLIICLTAFIDYSKGATLDCLGSWCDNTNQYCQIQLREGTAHCYTHHGHGHHEDHQKCIGTHHPDDHCFCREQACIDQMKLSLNTPAPTPPAIITSTMAAAQTTVAAVPTTVAAVQTTMTVQTVEVFQCFGLSCFTPKVCAVTFVNSIPVSGSCQTHQASRQECGPLPTNGECECSSALCMGLINTLTTQNQNTGSTQAPVQSQTTTSYPTGTTPIVTCSDNEDSLFNCKHYNDQFGVCSSFQPTLQNIARTRCPKFCKLCGGNGTAPTQATLIGTTSLPPCVDHDARCSNQNFKQILCGPNTPAQTKKFAIATCPKSCNYCNEYFASITEPVICNVCGDLNNLIPCSKQEIYHNGTSNTPKRCSFDKPYCMTDVSQDNLGNSDVYKRCVDGNTCQTKWLSETADLDYCKQYGVIKNPAPFECHFCCHGDNCNTDIAPPQTSWVRRT